MDDSKLELAKQFYDVSFMERNILRVTHGKEGPLERHFHDAFATEVTNTLAKMFTNEELENLIEFYSSELGRSFVDKSEQLGKEYTRIITQLLSSQPR